LLALYALAARLSVVVSWAFGYSNMRLLISVQELRDITHTRTYNGVHQQNESFVGCLIRGLGQHFQQGDDIPALEI
jgi:hypothetical protein